MASSLDLAVHVELLRRHAPVSWIICTRVGPKWPPVFARVGDAPNASYDQGLSVQSASAVRLLYATLQSLDGHLYWEFVETLDAHVRERLTILDVLDFLRMALEVPAEEYLLLVPLINKAHRAFGTFGKEPPEERGAKVAHLSSLILP